MTSVTIYHNPRCSKSRQTLALLEENGCKIDIIEYLKTPPDSKTLSAILKALKLAGVDLVRTGEAEYKESGLSKDSSDADVIDAIALAPKLMQRPIVVSEKGARIGRPPEAVLEII